MSNFFDPLHKVTFTMEPDPPIRRLGFIENFRVECLRSILVNTNLIEAAYNAGVERYFFSSSACAYNTDLQKDPNVRALKETDAYPAMAERGYGWEKLMSEMVCEEYTSERGMPTAIARFHNVYGPYGTWTGGREKAPAAMCRKIAQVEDGGTIEVWGDGTAIRSYTYVDDMIEGIYTLTHSQLKGPVNIGCPQYVSVKDLVDTVADVAGKKIKIK